jgi:hypothetical protein
MGDSEATVATPSVAYTKMAAKWELIDALLGGTAAMRAKRMRYLPKEGREEMDNYDVRLNRSFLYPGLKGAVGNLAAKPFSKPITIKEEDALPEELEPIYKNADREGTNLSQFALDAFQSALAYGHVHVLVDVPKMEEGTSLEDQRTNDLRPYFTLVHATNLISWTYRKEPNGTRVLAEVRIKECRIEKDGQWGDAAVEYIRVIRENEWALWRKGKDDEKFVPVTGEDGKGENSFGAVPIVTLYVGEKTGPMSSEPPLWTLAETNLCHWQSSSDHRASLRFSRFGLLFLKGLTGTGDMQTPIGVGPSAVFKTESVDADGKILEHSGNAIKASREDLEQLEEQMDILALQPFLHQPGNPTATGKAIDESKAHSSIICWIRNLEIVLEQAYAMAAEWVDEELPENFSADVFSDFGLSLKASEDVQSLIALRVARELSRRTLLNEVKRRGLLADTVSVDDELEAIETEAPAVTPANPNQPAENQPAPAKGAPAAA